MPRSSIPRPDVIRLRHMLDAAREAMDFARGKTEHNIGEAASKVSEPTRSQLPQIPWLDIVDMRNHLIHAYFDVDVGVVWDTISKDLPPLVSALDVALTSAE